MATLIYVKSIGKNYTNLIFGNVAISVGLWGIGAFMISITPKYYPDVALFWWQIAYVGVIFIPVF
ncbi:MAG: hypothetical protein PHV17_08200, partial [Candidatus Omnitrophica bacterium]|nr:hypothetical protein [Candidatus Omnitrophota bacterium]